MNREDVIRMAWEAGFDPHDMSDDFTCNLENIERFAALVAAAEREACAKLCDDEATIEGVAQRCADAIRARSNV